MSEKFTLRMFRNLPELPWHEDTLMPHPDKLVAINFGALHKSFSVRLEHLANQMVVPTKRTFYFEKKVLKV